MTSLSRRKSEHTALAWRELQNVFTISNTNGNIPSLGDWASVLLDAVNVYLLGTSRRTHSIKKFLPDALKRTETPRYFVGDIQLFAKKVDYGLCMEFIKHLIPLLFADLRKQRQCLEQKRALFNCKGQPKFVKNEDTRYLDLIKREHIVSFSLKAISITAEPLGFKEHHLKG